MTTTTTPDQRSAKLEANRALGRRFFAEQDRLRGGPAPELCATSYTALLGSTPSRTRDEHEGFAKAFYAAFPDMHHELEQIIAEESAVVVRFVLHGTNTGSFFGMPPTQRRVAVPAHVILRVEQGKVTELFGIFDEAGMMRQLGAEQG
jgi:predicted ester cyclase